MMVVPVNILSLPVLLSVWAIDAFVFLVSLRWLLHSMPVMRQKRFYRSLVGVADWLPDLLHSWLDCGPRWVSWVVIILAALLLRYVMVHGVILPLVQP